MVERSLSGLSRARRLRCTVERDHGRPAGGTSAPRARGHRRQRPSGGDDSPRRRADEGEQEFRHVIRAQHVSRRERRTCAVSGPPSMGLFCPEFTRRDAAGQFRDQGRPGVDGQRAASTALKPPERRATTNQVSNEDFFKRRRGFLLRSSEGIRGKRSPSVSVEGYTLVYEFKNEADGKLDGGRSNRYHRRLRHLLCPGAADNSASGVIDAGVGKFR